MARVWFYPQLHLDAVVKKPDSEKVPRYQKVGDVAWTPIGDAYFFRLAITNGGNASARDVQVVLAKVERMTGGKPSPVDRTSMNLKWTHTGNTSRNSLMPNLPPVFCDFIHVSDPASQVASGENLDTVAQGDTVLCLDVEGPPPNKANLLEPGTYRFHLILVAENNRARSYTVEVWCSGKWFPNQDEMFDKGFKMSKQ